MLLSLRKVDDPGTQAVISSLVFNAVPNDGQGSAHPELSEESKGNNRGGGSAEILQGNEVEVRQRNPSLLEA